MQGERFDMKDLGEAKFVLGMKISQDRQKRKTLSQGAYLEEVLHRYGNEQTYADSHK